MIIKHVLIRLSKANLITPEIIMQLKNIFKENLLIRTTKEECIHESMGELVFVNMKPTKPMQIINSAGPIVQEKKQFIAKFLE